LDEPDPFRQDEGRALPALAVKTATYYRFPPGGRFDAEGLAIDGDRALVVAKTLDGREAEVYALPLKPPAPLLRPALPEPVGTLPGFTEPVPGADLSGDGRLVVCSTGAVGIYQKDGAGSWRPVARRAFRGGDGIEAVAWAGNDLILAGEGRGVYRIAEA